MSDSVREALEVLRDNIRDEKGSVQRLGIRDNDDTRDAIAVLLDNEAALSANGGEPPTWTAEDEPVAYLTWHQVRHAIDDYEDVVALSHKDDRSADGTPAFPVYTHPAPSSVAVPEQREWNQVTGRDGFKYTEGWNACREAMLTAAPSPDHSGDANKMVTPSVPENEIKARALEDAAIKVVAEAVEIEIRLDDGQDIVEGTALIEEHIAEWLHKEAARLRTAGDEGEE